MGINEIIEYIEKEGIIRKHIQKINGRVDYDCEDLIQDIYVDLYNKDIELLNRLYDEGKLTFYLLRIVINNIRSTNSPFYRTYKRTHEDLETIKNKNFEDGY